MEMKKKDDSSRKTAIHIYTFVRIYLSVYSLHSFFCRSYFTHIKNRNPKNSYPTGDIATYLENEYNNTNVLSGLRSFDVCECIVRFQRLCVLYF